MIRKLEKPKKTVSKKTLRNKADKLLQEIGRIVYGDKGCLVCEGEYSCLHHFKYKSQSTALRYDLENCIPICASCHHKIHNGRDDFVAARIGIIMGDDWIRRLEEKKRDGAGKYYGVGFYKQKVEELTEILSMLKL